MYIETQDHSKLREFDEKLQYGNKRGKGDIFMAAYRQVFVSFWQDAFVLDLTPEEKYFYIYLMTNGKTSQCGIYELPLRVIEMDTGYNRETVEKLIDRFISYGKILYCKETKEIMILNWLKYNLVNSPKVKSCMKRELCEVKNKDFVKKLAEVIKEQKLVEDLQWIPNLEGKDSILASSKENISTLNKPSDNPLNTLSLTQENPKDTLSIPQEKSIGTVSILQANPIDNISLDYGEEREIEKELEEEIEEEREGEQDPEEKVDTQAKAEGEKDKEKKLLCHSLSLIKYFENLTGQIGALNLTSVKAAVAIHGHYNVKRAVDKALEVNKPNMNYVNGILKNWAVEGYPKQWEGVKYGGSSTKGNNKGKSSEFKPKEYRDLTEKEWADHDSELL